MTRMITSNYPYTALNEQFRMTPEIADLLKGTYPDMKTHPHLDLDERRLPETYIKYPIFWWNHESYEYKGISPCNEPEAEKVCALAKYLLLHGIEEKQLTIIAGYQGQVTGNWEHDSLRMSAALLALLLMFQWDEVSAKIPFLYEL